MSELEMKVNSRDLTKIWTKSENMWAKETAEGDWEELHYFDGWPTYDKWYSSTTVHGASTLHSHSVKAKPIIFYPERMVNLSNENDKLMYLCLRNLDKYYQNDDQKWDPNNEWTTIGDRLTSINSHGYMLALPIPFTIDQLPSIDSYSGNRNTMIIGCEDANGDGSDHDTNDIVFLVVGYPNVPEILSTTEVIKKRYMCEDLGATDDFDFNDIVVDVTQTTTRVLTTNPENQADNVQSNGNFTLSWHIDTNNTGQTARLAHVCGTLPFQVVVGDTKFPVVSDPTVFNQTREELAHGTTTRAQNEVLEDGWNPNEVKNVTGWDPATNNIKIFVKWEGGRRKDDTWHESNITEATGEERQFSDFTDGNFIVARFPENGSVPYIIATDQDVPWMKERVDIPDSWVGRNNTTAIGPKDNTGAADQGNRLNKPEDSEEVTLWNGPYICTEQYNTGVKMNRLSEFHAAITEAIEAGYNVLNVYTTNGNIGLSCIVTEGEWQRLTEQDAEWYQNGVKQSDGTYRHTIWLTGDQLRRMKQLGVFVRSYDQNLEMYRITMTKAVTKELTLSYPRYGKITSSVTDRNRYHDGDVPFEKAAFPIGTEITLTATPNTGCTFVKWSDGNTDNPRTITLSENMSLGASFTNDKDPRFHVKEPSEFKENNAIPTVYPSFPTVRFWQSNEKQDLNFESVKVIDETHTTIVLDCDKYTTDETGFVLQTHSTTYEPVHIRNVSEENPGTTSMTWIQNSPNIRIKTAKDGMGKSVFEMWQSAPTQGEKDESVHIFVTVYAKKKSFILNEEPTSINLSYLNPDKVIGFSWIRQSNLNVSMKDNANNAGVWKDSNNQIHIDAKKNGDGHLVINYSGSDHYLGYYKDIPVTVSDYSWDVCGMHLLRVNGAQDANKFTITDGDMRLATQNWNYDKNIKVVVRLQGSGLISTTITNGTKSHAIQPVPTDGFSKFNSTYDDNNTDALPARSIVFILSAKDYYDNFSGKNLIVNFETYDNSDLVPTFYVTETTENAYAAF